MPNSDCEKRDWRKGKSMVGLKNRSNTRAQMDRTGCLSLQPYKAVLNYKIIFKSVLHCMSLRVSQLLHSNLVNILIFQ